MNKSDIFTLDDAKVYVMNRSTSKGVICPCCDQFVKVYNRKLNSSMARSLIHVATYFINSSLDHSDEYVHVETLLESSPVASNFPMLRFWGLIESKEIIREDGCKNAGFWRPTRKGYFFVKDQITVPKRVQLFNNECLGFSEEITSIREALGNKFNYTELMRANLNG